MLVVLFGLVAVATAHSIPNNQDFVYTYPEWINFLTIFPDFNLVGVAMNSYYMSYKAEIFNSETKDGRYIMSLPLSGYKKEDIEVLARAGGLAMRAIHKNGEKIETSVLALSVLPTTINPAGRWSYDGNKVKIVFLLNNNKVNVGWEDADKESIPVRAIKLPEELKTV